MISTVLFPKNNYAKESLELNNYIDSTDLENINAHIKVYKYELKRRIDNINNVNTDGYKKFMFYSSKIQFDKINKNLTGEEYFKIISNGIYTDFSQGSLKSTGQNFDYAISGEGFFVLKDDNDIVYTRNGHFDLLYSGLLVEKKYNRNVQGWNANYNSINKNYELNTSQNYENIKVPLYGIIPPKETTELYCILNLNSDSNLYSKDKSTISTSANIYDAVGNSHRITFTSRKVSKNKWEMVSNDKDNWTAPLKLE